MTQTSKCSLCLKQYNFQSKNDKKIIKKIQHNNTNSRKRKKSKAVHKYGQFSGSKTELELINPQMSVVFLVHDILDIPLEECAKYLVKYGNPADWVTLCHGCATTLENARYLNRQIVQLQNRLEELKKLMTDQMRVKDEAIDEVMYWDDGNKSWLTAAYEIRQYMSDANDVDELIEEKADSTLTDSLVSNIKHVDYKFETDASSDVDECEPKSMVFNEDESEFDVESSSLSPESVNQDFEWEFVESSNEPEDDENEQEFLQDDEEGDECSDKGQLIEQDYHKNFQSQLSTTKDTTISTTSKDEKSENEKRKENSSNTSISVSKPEDDNKLQAISLEKEKHSTALLENDEELVVVRRPLSRRTYGKPISQNVEAPHSSVLTKITLDLGDPSTSVANSSTGIQKSPAASSVPLKGSYQFKFDKTVRGAIKLSYIAKNPPSFPCKDCKQVFPIASQLATHVNVNHTEGIKCSVSTCGKVLTSIKALENHTRATHNPGEVSLCFGCHKRLPMLQDFNAHLKNNPECTELAVLCTLCKVSKRYFSTQKSLDIHMEVQHIQPPLNCFGCSVPTCGKRFNSKSLVDKHVTEHHSERSFICTKDKCGKAFASSGRLKLHIKAIHLSKEPGAERFPCKTCPMVFNNKCHLKRHEKLHGDDAPYLCPVCGKRYKVGGQLTTHMWSHDPDRYEKYSLYSYKNNPKPRKYVRRKKGKGKAGESSIKEDSSTTNTATIELPNPEIISNLNDTESPDPPQPSEPVAVNVLN